MVILGLNLAKNQSNPNKLWPLFSNSTTHYCSGSGDFGSDRDKHFNL